MKKKIIFIASIAMLVVLAASLACVFAYGEASKQPAESDFEQIETAPEEPSIIIDESDEIVKIWLNNEVSVQEKIKMCEDKFSPDPILEGMWNPQSETFDRFISYDYKDLYTMNRVPRTYGEYLEDNKDAYACICITLRSHDQKEFYNIFLAPIEVSNGVAELVLFRISKPGEFKKVYDNDTMDSYYVKEKDEAKYYKSNFKFQFDDFPDKDAMILGAKSGEMTFEFKYILDLPPELRELVEHQAK